MGVIDDLGPDSGGCNDSRLAIKQNTAGELARSVFRHAQVFILAGQHLEFISTLISVDLVTLVNLQNSAGEVGDNGISLLGGEYQLPGHSGGCFLMVYTRLLPLVG